MPNVLAELLTCKATRDNILNLDLESCAAQGTYCEHHGEAGRPVLCLKHRVVQTLWVLPRLAPH